jgi:tRNA A-37 threonylcarbamoyl transferase component Bud32
VLASLPEGYELVRAPRGVLAVERGASARLAAGGFGPEGSETLEPSDLAGRAPLGVIAATADGDERWVVRRFHHGGWLRVLGERLFLAPERPFHELVLADALRAAALPTPRVVAARAVRSGLVGWRLALVCARVAVALDLAAWLERARRGEVSVAERRRTVERVGELVGHLHARRFLHADLHPRNVLLERASGAAWILDLDRARFVATLTRGARRDNLRRLYRAVRRREARGRAFLRRTDYLRFLRAYSTALGAVAPSSTGPSGELGWSADWTAIVRRDRARAPLHRLGWVLERWFGDGPERRDGAAVLGDEGDRGAPLRRR